MNITRFLLKIHIGLICGINNIYLFSLHCSTFYLLHTRLERHSRWTEMQNHSNFNAMYNMGFRISKTIFVGCLSTVMTVGWSLRMGSNIYLCTSTLLLSCVLQKNTRRGIKKMKRAIDLNFWLKTKFIGSDH